MHNPPHSERDSDHNSSHGHTRRDDHELHKGVTPYAEGSCHPDSSSYAPARRPYADIPYHPIGPDEQNVHAIENRTGHHTDERSHRSSADDTAASRPLRSLERNAAEKQIRLLEVQLQKAQRENHTKDDKIDHLNRHLSGAQRDIGQYRMKDAHSQELLDAQRQELQGVRAFLNMTDSYSGGDIIKILNTLNSEIFQAAAVITDTVEGAHPGGGRHRRSDDASAVEKVRRALGDGVKDLLQPEGNGIQGENITIIQAALQTSLNIALEDICRQWSKDDLVDKTLNNVYAQIRAKQEQVLVSGIWRSLTRAKTKCLVYQEPSLKDLAKDLAERMKSDFSSRYIHRYDAVHSCLGYTFDARIMEDADGGETSSGTVLLVTEMGLKRVDKDPAGPDKVTLLLKPKVFLRESFFG
ncbi:hypothetical protein BDP27DRAFT_1351032 [Rhodocollybia butyracea]|uniref:Uncharacterized protein n=1 Tax=Rhodocollybia butyracea TaxID=206335 RepID=A0A9P5P4X1_9AGAR|nr:hypothetical protein BDP27DRAFT_1351032 [Rhodocollybia butyracea]